MTANDGIKRNDQINLLGVCREFTDTGEFNGIFTYPNCGYDLVEQGLVTEDRKITKSGRAALWLLGKEPDTTSSEAAQTFNLKIDK